MDKQKQLEKIAKLAEVVKQKRESLVRASAAFDASWKANEQALVDFNMSNQVFDDACAELTGTKPHPTLVGPKPIPVADIPL